MSQRIFKRGTLNVLCGWDRPLRYFFLIIEDEGAGEGDPAAGLVFDNLKRTRPGMTVAEIRMELEKLEITPPPTLYADLEDDKRHNRGNLTHDYDKPAG